MILPIQQIESILFIANKPLTIKKLATIVGADRQDIRNSIALLQEKYNQQGSGVRLLKNDSTVQFTTAPESSDAVQQFLKSELTGEMTKPQLETLTIIAYRGPIAKNELELIRGVNCSLILRNLLIRGLIEEVSGSGLSRYQTTLDFLRFLGVDSVSALPDYEKLSQHENIEILIESQKSKK